MNVKRHSAQRFSLSTYFLQHIRAFKNSLNQLSLTPIATLITFAVIGIAIALPSGLFVLLKNIQVISHGLHETSQISLYLKSNTPPLQVNSLFHSLQNDRDIADVQYISPEQGLHDFQQQLGIGHMLAELPDNPLPGVMIVEPTPTIQTSLQANQLLARLKQNPIVENAQLDMAWLQRLHAMIQLAHRAIYAIMLLFAFTVLLVIGNTIRLTTQSFCDEIMIIKLLGGTERFIRRPFLYSGIIYGLSGGIIAWLLIDLFMWWLHSPVEHLAKLYDTSFIMHTLGFRETLSLLFYSALLGYLGSWIAVRKHFKTAS